MKAFKLYSFEWTGSSDGESNHSVTFLKKMKKKKKIKKEKRKHEKKKNYDKEKTNKRNACRGASCVLEIQ